ncbi:MAG: hypothetical protein NVSMB57_15360 [Actinomycetota bacterium]
MQVLRKFGSSRTVSLGYVQTNDSGEFSYDDTPDRSTAYSVDYTPEGTVGGPSPSPGGVGGSACTGATSREREVGVRPGLSFLPTSGSKVAVGKSVSFKGTIKPAHPGLWVYLQTLSGKTWKKAASYRLDARSSFRFTYSKGQKGMVLFRVIYPTQDLDHLWNVSRNLSATWR